MQIESMRGDLNQECGCGTHCLTNLRQSLGDSVKEVYNLRERRFNGTHTIHTQRGESQ